MSAKIGEAAVTQSSSVFTSIINFYTEKSKAVTGVFPEVKDLVLELDNADLVSFAVSLSNNGPSFQAGGAVEAAHLVAGIQREYALLGRSKELYFSEASLDSANDSIHFQESSGRFISLIKGLSTEMSPT